MDCQLRNRVKNLPKGRKERFLPLFEAINNSIQAIKMRKNTDGYIDIRIIKETNDIDIDGDSLGIESIEVIDNGIGFDKQNFESFSKLDSEFKKEIGGKGVGRLFYLSCFKSISIKSVFDDNGQKMLRSFNFSAESEITNEKCEKVDKNTPLKTIVKMEFPTKEYLEFSRESKEQIKFVISEKFLNFLLQDNPKFHIAFNNDDFQNLNETTSKSIRKQSEEKLFEVNGKQIKGKGYLVEDPNGKNLLLICAQGVVIKSFDLNKFLDIPESFFDDKSKLKVFLYGNNLDDDVNESRSDFNNFTFQKNGGELDSYNLLPLVTDFVHEFAEPWIKSFNDEKKELVTDYIKSNGMEYAYLLDKPDTNRQILNLPMKTIKNKKDFATELFKIDRSVEENTTSELEKFLENNGKNDLDPKILEELTNKISDSTKTNLTKYVIRREQIIKLLEKVITWNFNKDYEKEKILHNIFIPQRKSSKNLKFEDHNLWLIDERLAYDYYLLSDKKLKDALVVSKNDDGNDRPDGFFAKVVSFTENSKQFDEMKSMTIVEFKRPGRDDYDGNNNPIEQVLDYIKQIKKAGQLIGLDGKIVSINKEATFHAYIIADLTSSLKDRAMNNDFIELPEGNGYFKFNQTLNVIIEIIPYAKVIKNAELRNEAFMRKIKGDLENIDLLSGTNEDD